LVSAHKERGKTLGSTKKGKKKKEGSGYMGALGRRGSSSLLREEKGGGKRGTCRARKREEKKEGKGKLLNGPFSRSLSREREALSSTEKRSPSDTAGKKNLDIIRRKA